MVYTRNQPIATDDLDVSQPILFNNTNGADDSFGIDHYQFSDLTANNGFHNKVTTPQFVTNPATLPSVPPTTTTNPILYGYQQLDGSGNPTTNTGVLQYSRGPSNAVPSPLTSLQSPSTPIVLAPAATTNIFNFSGITKQVIALAYAADFAGLSPNNISLIIWNGSVVTVFNLGSSILSFTSTGTTLQLKNNSGGTLSNIAWTLEFKRIIV